MPLKLDRQTAHDMVVKNIGVNNLLKHVLAVEAGMRRLAEHFEEDVEYWGLTGLVHDLDYNQTKDDHAKHSYVTETMLTEYDLPEDMLYAIHAHPGHVPCRSRLDWSLYAVDPTSGFIVACALMHPDKKLSVITPEFMLKRFKEKRFAAGAIRDNMAACSNIGLDLEQFLILVWEGMMTISDELGL